LAARVIWQLVHRAYCARSAPLAEGSPAAASASSGVESRRTDIARQQLAAARKPAWRGCPRRGGIARAHPAPARLVSDEADLRTAMGAVAPISALAASSWSIVASPGSGSASNDLADVTRASASDCWVVGGRIGRFRRTSPDLRRQVPTVVRLPAGLRSMVDSERGHDGHKHARTAEDSTFRDGGLSQRDHPGARSLVSSFPAISSTTSPLTSAVRGDCRILAWGEVLFFQRSRAS
jgi:hypothetical protein